MNLTQQFLVILIFPLSFVLMAIYSAWKGVHRPRIRRDWILSLLVAALWASSLLGIFTGRATPVAVPFTWEVIGRHALSLLSLMLLLTTTQYLLVPQAQTRLVIVLSGVLWVASMALDPAIWPFDLGRFTVAGQQVSHFDLWAAVWVAAWFVPLLAAWLLARRAYLNAPGAIYRNQLAYWLLMLLLFALGGGLALIQQPNQPFWQQVGTLVQIGAGLLGVVLLTHSQLPDLRLTLRRTTGRLTATAVIFGLSVVAMLVLYELIPTRPGGNTTFFLILAAAAFTLLFMLINRLVRQLVSRWLLPTAQFSQLPLFTRPDIARRLEKSAALGEIILEHIQKSLSSESGRIFLLEPAKAGRVHTHTLAAIGTSPAADATFAAGSLFLDHLQHDPAGWLAQYDIDSLPTFAPLPDAERAVLTGWQHELYMPLHAGESLAGILALSSKFTGEPYEDADIEWLRELCGPAGLLLVQAHRLESLRSTTSEIQAAYGAMRRQNQQLSALQRLHHRFVNMITPELRRPLAQINSRIRLAEAAQAEAALELETHSPVAAATPLADTAFSWNALEEQLTELRLPVESLVAIASRLQNQQSFTFAPVHIDDVLYRVQRDLAGMADARRVTIEADLPGYLPAVTADEARLVEALRNLVHNAVKFNKIGGSVQISGDVQEEDMVIQVTDTGVGIPPERLDAIWEAYQGQENGRFRSTTPSLGLLFARFIVEAHGGYITVSSEYGEGSTFSVYLPLNGDE